MSGKLQLQLSNYCSDSKIGALGRRLSSMLLLNGTNQNLTKFCPTKSRMNWHCHVKLYLQGHGLSQIIAKSNFRHLFVNSTKKFCFRLLSRLWEAHFRIRYIWSFSFGGLVRTTGFPMKGCQNYENTFRISQHSTSSM